MNLYEIAGKVIALCWDSQFIHGNMASFCCDPTKKIDLTFELQENIVAAAPKKEPLIYSTYLSVYAMEDGYFITYPNSGNVNSCYYNQNLSHAIIYLSDQLSASSYSEEITLESDSKLSTIDFIFYAIRDIFFTWIQQKGILAVHSSSLIYNNKAYLFSASSGTGKTTHTNMWVAQYGVEILDGDVTAICIEDGEPIAYGLPWCGTSKRYLNKRILLGGIIFLSRSSHNSVSKLTPFEAILRLTARCFTPTWTKELTNLNLSIAESLVVKTRCCLLNCLPNQEAVNTMKDYIENSRSSL